jgi:plastocyanin
VVPQPAHIHLATCTKIGGVKYPLTNIENGSSVTTLAVSIDDLLKDLPLAVNVHKSATAATVYVACGDIPAPATDTMMNTSSTTTTGVTGNATPGGLVTEVVIVNYSATGFSPKDISVKAGQTVRFVNTTASGMSVASDDHPAHTIYPEFDQWKDAKYKGQKTYEFTFTKVGTWAYHNHMKETDGGTVNVK